MWLLSHKRIAVEAILSLLVALSFSFGIIVHKKNNRLTESLKMAQNNVEAYRELVNNSRQANRVLQLTVEDFKRTCDKVIQRTKQIVDSVGVKPKQLKLTATVTQTANVKKVEKHNLQLSKDTVCTDSIIYNPETKLYYTINKDSLSTTLSISNQLYLIVYQKKEYIRKKSFIKRLFTFDFKKRNVVSYKFVNSNSLIQQDSVRVVEYK